MKHGFSLVLGDLIKYLIKNGKKGYGKTEPFCGAINTRS